MSSSADKSRFVAFKLNILAFEGVKSFLLGVLFVVDKHDISQTHQKNS